jgi:predicted nuclease of predicted toxin-antitoxin system
MKFVVDAHLPPVLCALLQSAGHDAVHTSRLPRGNRTPDPAINELSLSERRVLITKDTDFYYSHLLHQGPYKLLLVRVGNCGTRELEALFRKHLPRVIEALDTHSLVELDRQSVQVLA